MGVPQLVYHGNFQPTGPANPPTSQSDTGNGFSGTPSQTILIFPDPVASTISAGDLIVVVTGRWDSTAIDPETIQSGDDWTELYNDQQATDPTSLAVFYRYAKEADKGGITFPHANATTFAGQVLVFRNVASTSPIVAQTTVTQAIGTDTVTTGSLSAPKNSMVVACCAIGDFQVGGTRTTDGSLTALTERVGTVSSIEKIVIRSGYETFTTAGTAGGYTFTTNTASDNFHAAAFCILGGSRTAWLSHTGDANWSDVLFQYQPNREDLNDGVIEDQGPNGLDLAWSGSTSLYDFISQANGASVQGNGSDYYFRVCGSPNDFLIPDGEFCLEFWYRVASANQTSHLWGLWNTTGNNRSFNFYVGTGDLYGYWSLAGTDFPVVQTTSDPSAGVWHHVALERNSSDLVSMYVDGTSVGTPVTSAGALFSPSSTTRFMIGGRNNGGTLTDSNFFIGGIRGTLAARYNGAFTPPDDMWTRGAIA